MTSSSRPCILVADDDHDTRVSLRDTLELRDYSVCSAANGRDALDLLESGECHPHLILLDLMMPLMNGWEFLNELRQRPAFSHIPVLVISASTNESKVSHVNGFVAKPLRLPQILELVSKHRLHETT